MSFILDALKKLEQNRKRGEVPDLTTVHLHDHEPPEKRSIWPYLLLAALLLNAGIFTAWLRPWDKKEAITSQHETQGIEEAAIAEQVKDVTSADAIALKAENIIENKEAAASTPAADNKIKGSIPKDIEKPEKPAEKKDEDIIASIGLNPTTEELDILRNKIKEEQDVINRIPIEEIVKTEEQDSESEYKGSLMEFSKLPDDVREELPDITINGHIYSDNRSARIANINGLIAREGDKVSSGLVLEEITTSGVIFSYKEHRFLLRAF